MPSWFQGNKDFSNIAQGLRDIGFSQDNVDALMGGNWYRFYKENFVPRS
jgi:microsomal dipeptidase-like Zn-dependent dipeptidase